MHDELMQWHVSLLQWIVRKKEHPEMAIAIKLSDINEGEWREHRRQLKNVAKQRLKDGKHLSRQKEAVKRTWDDMSSTEKQLIEDYETNKSTTEYEILLVKKPRT